MCNLAGDPNIGSGVIKVDEREVLVANGDVPVTRSQCGDRYGGEIGNSLSMRKVEMSKTSAPK